MARSAACRVGRNASAYYSQGMSAPPLRPPRRRPPAELARAPRQQPHGSRHVAARRAAAARRRVHGHAPRLAAARRRCRRRSTARPPPCWPTSSPAAIPDRAPGTAGADGAARWVRSRFAGYGFRTESHRFAASIPGRGRFELQNLVAKAVGRSPDVIAVVAHRDDAGTCRRRERQRVRHSGARRARARRTPRSPERGRSCRCDRRTRSSSSRRTAARSAPSARRASQPTLRIGTV